MTNKRTYPNRRAIIKTATAAAIVPFAAPYISRAEAAEETLSINTWGGAWEESAKKYLFDAFAAETGVKIKTVSPVSVAKLEAQRRSGVYEFDVTTLGVAPLAQANSAGLLEPVEGYLSEKDLFPGAIANNGVASHVFGNNIVYRTDVFGQNGPKNWAEFWDVKKFPGDRSLQKYAPRVLAFALMADGVPKEKLYPYDLNRAFASLDKIKPHIVSWWEQGPQSTQMIRDKEVVTLGMWAQFAKTAIDGGTPAKVIWNECVVDTAYWVVSKGTPRAKLAWEFIKSAVKAERVAPFAASSGMGPLNPEGLKYIDPKLLPYMPTAPEYKDQVVYLSAEGIASQIDEMEKRFAQWLLR